MAQPQQTEKRQPASTGIGVGGSSILSVFVILCLTTFATLALVSAQADLRLTTRSAQSVTLYYQADAQAQELLAELADYSQEALTSQEVQTLTYVTAVEPDPDGVVVRFSIPMDETRNLEGSIRFDSTGGQEIQYYRVASATPAGGITLEDNLDVWNGQVPTAPLP